MKAKTSKPKRAASDEFAPKIRGPLPGPKAKKVLERDRKVITPAYTRGYPLVIERGEGSYVIDPDGNRFLDFTAGVAVNALGHAHPEIVKTIEKPAINQRLIDNGLQPAPSTPGELEQFVKQQLVAWGRKIKDAGIQPE